MPAAQATNLTQRFVVRAAKCGLLVVIIVLSFRWGAGPAQAQSFEGLGDLPGSVFYSDPTGLSADGLVIVGVSESANGSEAFRWTSGGGMVGLGDLAGGGFDSQANGVSADGSVIVGRGESANGTEAFRWTSGGGMVGLGDLAGGFFYSAAYGTSADGSVIVGMSQSTNGPEAFRWTSGGGMVGLGDLAGGSFNSIAYGISADGSVIVGRSNSANGNEAFRWTSGGGMVGLGDLAGGSFNSQAYGISADGSVIVGLSESANGFEAFRWTSGGGMVGLGDLAGGSFVSSATAVNADGSVIVGASISANGTEAFRWTQADGMQSIRALLVSAGVDMTGWDLVEARGVSADGRTIAGSGTDPSADTEAWIAYFGPSGAGLTTAASQQQSLNDVADARAGAMAQQHGFAAPLLGDDKPFEATSEMGVYAAGGSASAGGWARYAFAGGVTVHAGIAYAREDYDRAEIDNSVTGALALRYVAAPISGVVPFVEAGGWYAPEADMEFERTYVNGAGTATGTGKTEGDLSYVFGRAGVLVNIGKNQLAISTELGRERLEAGGYTETNDGNAFSATVAAGADSMDLVKARLAYSFDITKRFDATVWVAGVYGFNRDSDVAANIQGIGLFTATTDEETAWAELGARVGYAVTEAVTLDVFVNGVSGEADEIDTRIHGGLAARVRF
jgi:probable HAF family extracellular repeat protein